MAVLVYSDNYKSWRLKKSSKYCDKVTRIKWILLMENKNQVCGLSFLNLNISLKRGYIVQSGWCVIQCCKTVKLRELFVAPFCCLFVFWGGGYSVPVRTLSSSGSFLSAQWSGKCASRTRRQPCLKCFPSDSNYIFPGATTYRCSKQTGRRELKLSKTWIHKHFAPPGQLTVYSVHTSQEAATLLPGSLSPLLLSCWANDMSFMYFFLSSRPHHRCLLDSHQHWAMPPAAHGFALLSVEYVLTRFAHPAHNPPLERGYRRCLAHYSSLVLSSEVTSLFTELTAILEHTECSLTAGLAG